MNIIEKIKTIHMANCVNPTKPTAIIAKTIKGKGVNFMENNNDWHHGRLTRNLYVEAIKSIKKKSL